MSKLTQPQQTYHSRFFEDFRAIESNDWRTQVRYFEEHEASINTLEFKEYFELLYCYTNSLFQIGNYEKHLLKADAVLELSVMNNIVFFNGEDVFRNTLFKKAASCFHTHRLEQCGYILKELLRIDPYDRNSALFLKKCLRHIHPPFLKQARAISILFFLASALIIFVEMLIIRTFYPEYSDTVEKVRNMVFLFGLGALVGSDFIHRFRTNSEVNNLVSKIRREKHK